MECCSFHLVPHNFEEWAPFFFSGKISSLAKAFLSKEEEEEESAKVAHSRNFVLP
jgi:hypothetical protein